MPTPLREDLIDHIVHRGILHGEIIHLEVGEQLRGHLRGLRFGHTQGDAAIFHAHHLSIFREFGIAVRQRET
jgi:hypothetical protein